MADDDADLIRRIADGDHTAFDAFYRRHVDRIVAYSVRRCRDPHEVAELCASVFLSVWERAATFDPTRGDAAPWLIGIASRRFVDLRRADRRQLALRDRMATQRVVDADDVERLGDRIDAVRASDDLVAALSALPPSQRDVVVLVALDGLSSGEAATLLGTNATAVRMRLSRARRTLRRAVGPDRSRFLIEEPTR